MCVHDSYRLAGAPLGQPVADRDHATDRRVHTTAHHQDHHLQTVPQRRESHKEPHQPRQRLEQRCETLFLGGVVDQGRGQLQRLHDVSCTPARVIVVQTLAVVHVVFLFVVVAHLDNQRAL